MPLAPGSRLGPYELLALVGAGGMGEVYRARDTRLNRTVAVKVLRSPLEAAVTLRERFLREAQTIASLEHPHICVLHDVGIESGIDFLVMEYLEGETLARRLEKGPLPVEPALRHAIAIADALDKAHRQGVVHRDLKPGNIMLTKQGVKLLDFGLATLRAERDGPALRIVSGETRLSSLTAEGTIVGTLQYMAPEQLEGKPCDPRTDIFALGSVVHEMVTGKRAFEAGSHTALIGAILEREPPPISSLRPDAPRALDHIVQRCLAKDVDERWQTAGDVMRELKWIGQSASEASLPMPVMAARRRPGRVAALATGLVAGALLGGLAVSLGRPTVDRPATYVAVSVQPAEYLLGPHPMEGSPRVGYRRPSRTAIAISPDGRHLVFAAVQGGTSRLFLRPFDRAEATPIAGTEGADSPFLSPDGASIGFWADGKLKRVPIGGGPVFIICDARPLFGASWGSDQTIVFAAENGPLWQVPVAGGAPQTLTTLQQGEYSHRLPHVLPGARAILFNVQKRPMFWDEAWVDVYSRSTGRRTRVLDHAADARYLPTGHLIYARTGTLMAAPFDLNRTAVTGPSAGVRDAVMHAEYGINSGIDTGAAQFAISDSGTFVYVSGGVYPPPERLLTWVTREGVAQHLAAPPRSYLMPRLSPDGQRVTMSTQVSARSGRHVWVYDIGRGILSRLSEEDSRMPVWTPDGKRIAFGQASAAGGYNVFWAPYDGSGTAERLTNDEGQQSAGSWSPDGRVLAYVHQPPSGLGDIYTVAVDENPRHPRPFLQTKANEGWPAFSPDGRWMAYASDESGTFEVYIRPYPGPGAKHQISTNGGNQPAWASNGRELFYRIRGALMAVAITTTPEFSAGIPRRLFEDRYAGGDPVRGYDVAPDGRFLMVVDPEPPAPPASQINVVFDWLPEFKRKLAGGS